MSAQQITYPPRRNGGCISNWEKDLKRTKNKQEEVCASKDRYYDKFTQSSLWEGKLKKVFDSLILTEELGKKVASNLDLFKLHTKKVCENTYTGREAIEILWCNVTELFACINGFKEFLVNFQAELNCLNDPALNNKTSIIILCVENITKKLEEAIAKQQELLRKICLLLRNAYILHESICAEDCSLKWQLERLCKLFPKSDGAATGNNCEVEVSCTAKIEPCPVLPLNKDDFYNITKNQYERSRQEKEEIRKKYDEAREICESVLSCKNSLEEALLTSKAAKECK